MNLDFPGGGALLQYHDRSGRLLGHNDDGDNNDLWCFRICLHLSLSLSLHVSLSLQPRLLYPSHKAPEREEDGAKNNAVVESALSSQETHGCPLFSLL